MKRTSEKHCPHCGKQVPWQENPFRPFCSDRCRVIDLGRWAAEEYRIPDARGAEEELSLQDAQSAPSREGWSS